MNSAMGTLAIGSVFRKGDAPEGRSSQGLEGFRLNDVADPDIASVPFGLFIAEEGSATFARSSNGRAGSC